MLYMSGPNDTLKELKEGEGCAGSLDAYAQQFAKANPELCAVYTDYKTKLPPYMPMYLVTVEAFDPATKGEVYRELSRFSPTERQAVRQIQQEGSGDVATQLTMTEFMEGLQAYAHNFREALKIPLLATPWNDINNSLTSKSLIKIFGETSTKSSDLIAKSTRFKTFDKLYEDMLARDALSREWSKLKGQYDKESRAMVKSLERKMEELSKQIKAQLPKRIKTEMSKYVRRFLKDEEIKRIRSKVGNPKRILTTNIDLLNRTGLGRLRAISTEFKWIGQGVSKFSKLLNWGAVAYDTVEAYNTNGKVARAFLTGAASVVVATELTTAAGGTAALGGYVIGALAGDFALGATILVCSPVIGWGILVIAGVATAGYVAYKAKEVMGGVMDLSEYADRVMAKEVSEAFNNTHNLFKTGWQNNSSWMPLYYGNNKSSK